MRSETKLNLGDVAKDKITGFEGVVIARTDWLNGCIRLVLQSAILDKGKPLEPVTFDVEQLELVKSQALQQGEPSGGPCDDGVALKR